MSAGIWLRSDVDVSLESMWRMCGWLNDPEVVRYSEQRHKKHDPHSQNNYICSFVHGEFKEIMLDNEPIGTITGRIDRNNGTADMGILIGEKRHWGNGYGTTAWALMMSDLFSSNLVRKVEAGCMNTNLAMMMIFVKTGMKPEGRRKDHFLFNGSPCDMNLWAKWR
jgi:ribosomal-protein-alanine N-acetyltransferase